ncbi:MAG: hypothetical protein RMK29_19345 [Myxococcales bacterium]|nr:hypothetical protein [Myxococcota bacterium]MDW8283862.1 hypothetical protein [Myxococcales bacterium]
MDQSDQSGDREIPPAAYDTFDEFLQAAIKEYYERGWRRPGFVALLLASGQAGALARDALSSPDGLKKLALGTFGLVAVRMILTRVLTGPLGLLLTGVSLASLIALFLKNQKEIAQKTARYRELIDRTRQAFDEAQAGYRQNRMDARERNLMVEGLLKRFLRECEEI